MAEVDEEMLSEEDEDLITQIDRDKKLGREKRMMKEIKEQNKLIHSEIKQNREKFTSQKSELISYCKLICDYFSYINNADNQ